MDLETVNKNLLVKLNELIEQAAEPAEIVELTNAVAKLNASSRNNELVATAKDESEIVEGLFNKLAEKV